MFDAALPPSYGWSSTPLTILLDGLTNYPPSDSTQLFELSMLSMQRFPIEGVYCFAPLVSPLTDAAKKRQCSSYIS